MPELSLATSLVLFLSRAAGKQHGVMERAQDRDSRVLGADSHADGVGWYDLDKQLLCL